MSRENDFYTRMTGDATLVTTLTGGVWKKESTGVEGITRETAAAAFDTNGYLKPCALVKERELAPNGPLRDPMTQQASASQVVEIYLYADAGAGYTAINTAKSRLYALFEGYQFSDSFEVEWVNSLPNLRDSGALKNAAMSRIDFAVYSIQ